MLTRSFSLGNACEESHDAEEARRHFAQAAGLRPEKPLWRLRAELCGPAVFENAREIEEYCERMKGVLERCCRIGFQPVAGGAEDSVAQTAAPAAPNSRAAPDERGEIVGSNRPRGRRQVENLSCDQTRQVGNLSYDDLLAAGVFPSFGLAYHGRDQRRLKEQFATLFTPYFRDEQPPVGSGLRDRKRIGILVTRRHEGMFLQSMRGIIEQLDGDRFDVVVLCSRAIVKTLQTRIRRAGLRFVPFGDSLPDAIRQVRGAACDLIYYWEVGTDAMNYFLPFARLAPVQCTGWARR